MDKSIISKTIHFQTGDIILDSAPAVVVPPVQSDFFQAIAMSNPDTLCEIFQNEDNIPWEWTESESDGYNAIHKCAVLNMFSMAKIILHAMKNRKETRDNEKIIPNFVNSPSRNGNRPIHFAAFRGNIDFIELLVSNGADIHVENDKGLNALHMAAQGDKVNSLIYLIEEYKFSLLDKDMDEYTPFHWACYFSSENFFKFSFIYEREMAVLINSQSMQGLTPLHLAVFSDKTKIIKKLHMHGASLMITDSKNRTPYQLALKKKKTNMASLLYELEDSNYYYSSSTLFKKQEKRSSKNFIIFLLSHIIMESLILFAILPVLEIILFTYFYIFSFVTLFTLFFLLSYSDPGYLTENISVEDSRQKLFQMIKKREVIDKCCPYCAVKREFMVKHCYYCNKCVKNFDHHCFWANNCVGQKNQKLFMGFVTWVVINFGKNIYVSFHGLMHATRNGKILSGGVVGGVVGGGGGGTKLNESHTFPPRIEFLENVHFYDREVQIMICSISLIMFVAFMAPILNLWMMNIQRCPVRKKDRQSSSNNVNERILIVEK